MINTLISQSDFLNTRLLERPTWLEWLWRNEVNRAGLCFSFQAEEIEVSTMDAALVNVWGEPSPFMDELALRTHQSLLWPFLVSVQSVELPAGMLRLLSAKETLGDAVARVVFQESLTSRRSLLKFCNSGDGTFEVAWERVLLKYLADLDQDVMIDRTRLITALFQDGIGLGNPLLDTEIKKMRRFVQDRPLEALRGIEIDRLLAIRERILDVI